MQDDLDDLQRGFKTGGRSAQLAYLRSELSRLRETNDAADISATETATIRGEIRAFKRLVDLLSPDAVKVAQLVVSDPGYQT